MMLGKLNGFSVEVEVVSRDQYVLGFARIWIRGQFIGDFEEIDILSTVAWCLSLPVKSKEVEVDELNFGDVEEEYKFILANDDIHDRAMMDLGECSYDFELMYYKKRGMMRLFWKIYPGSIAKFPDYPRGLNHADFPVSDVTTVIDELNSVIAG